jgi:hypothetical protein
MAVIHIPEAEAGKDLGSLMKKAALGDEVLIEGATSYFRLVPDKPILRTGKEILERLAALPGPRPVMDADFAADVRNFRERHAGESFGDKWD